MQEVPVPEAGFGEVRIQVAAAGVCLSDVHLIAGVRSPQISERNRGQLRTLGHEVSGTVDQIGAGVSGWSEGDRVTLNPLTTTSRGLETMGVDYDGGWASYVVVPAEVLVPIPDSLPFDQAAIIPDAVSTPWAAIETTAKVQAGEAVAVWGCGGLGIHAIQLLRMIGAAPIIAVDPLEQAREAGLQAGADVALDPNSPDFGAKVLAANGGAPLDVAFDIAGFPGIPEQALGLLARGGRLVITGISGQPISIEDSATFISLEQKVYGHYGTEARHIPQLVRLAGLGRLDLSKSVTDVLPLSDAPLALKRLEDKKENIIRLVLDPRM